MEIITKNKIKIIREEQKVEQDNQNLIDNLELNKGMFLSSGTEYPGRYSRWETGFCNPPVEIIGYSKSVKFFPLNEKGEEIVRIFEEIFNDTQDKDFIFKREDKVLVCDINFSDKFFCEENRSKQPSILSPIRVLLKALKNNEKDPLGFYGAFGFDLLFQFEKITLKNKRDESQPIVRLLFPNKIYTFDRKKENALVYSYEFQYKNFDTTNKKDGEIKTVQINNKVKIEDEINSTLSDKQYALMVEKSKENMRNGDIFELVLRRRYYTKYTGSSSDLFRKIIKINPSPYQFFCQFEDEKLIGASPEMFVRVTDNRVETCPISGTIKRGKTPIEDAFQIKTLLNSKKDEVELTMCTDVDRSDKSRVCKAGSIRLLGRRQIEKYKNLFHTVDHVEGILREDCDGIDAFLSHMWAVTLMGSPKSTALRLIEQYENEPREYYGGAVGALFCNGNLNTGITIRTIHLKNNIASYSVGASLVYDSNGDEEAIETQIKASSFFNIFNKKEEIKEEIKQIGLGLKIVVIDNQDSFVNTLSDYFRQTGANVITFRAGVELNTILEQNPDMIMHSPGPKLPKDFNVPTLVQQIAKHKIPQFGVCLGLQGMVEAFNGSLLRIETPRHGKVWRIKHNNENIFKDLEQDWEVGAYHSWVADEKSFPACLEITAKCERGYIMGIAHKTEPIWAVQFHPESIMSMKNNYGHRLIENVIKCVKENKNK